MNGMALLLVLTTPGIEYGWQPGPDGKLEYIIQLEPQALEALKGGREISSDLHPDVRGVRRFVLKVGEGPVPRIAVHPDALENGDEEEENLQENTQSKPASRSPPPLLRRGARQTGAAEAEQRSQEDATDDQNQFTLSDETEDGAGPYDSVETQSRYSDSVDPAESDAEDGLWARWNQDNQQPAEDNQWQGPESQPEIDPRDIPPDADAAWAQGEDLQQPLGFPDDRRGTLDARRNSRTDVRPPEFANRNVPEQGEYMPTGYSQPPLPANTGQQTSPTPPTNSVPGSTESASQLATNQPANAPTSSTNDLFKELLLFASLGVNVVAVVIARQYYMRYCMLMHELRQSESLAA